MVFQSFYLFRFRTIDQNQFINWSDLVLRRLESTWPSGTWQVVVSTAVPWICCISCDNNKEFHKQLVSSMLNINSKINAWFMQDVCIGTYQQMHRMPCHVCTWVYLWIIFFLVCHKTEGEKLYHHFLSKSKP